MSNLGRAFKFLLIAALAAAFVTFAVANRDGITISLFPFPYSAELPMFLFAIICFGLGAIIAMLLMGIRSLKIRGQLVAERKKTAALENERKLQQSDQLALVRKA